MDRKETMDGGCKKLSELSSNKIVATSPSRKWEEGSSNSSLSLQGPRSRGQNEVHRELTSSEFLDFLRKQGPDEEEQFRSARTDGKFRGKSMHSKVDRKQEYESAAIDQCGITSSVDYGSRDYYQTSNHTSVLVVNTRLRKMRLMMRIEEGIGGKVHFTTKGAVPLHWGREKVTVLPKIWSPEIPRCPWGHAGGSDQVLIALLLLLAVVYQSN